MHVPRFLLLDANHPRCKIPKDYAEGGEIVFNISPTAVRDFKITNEFVEFKASFSGVIHIISAPIKAILSAYAEENGEGVFFDPEGEDSGTMETALIKDSSGGPGVAVQAETLPKEVSAKGKPFLKLVE